MRPIDRRRFLKAAGAGFAAALAPAARAAVEEADAVFATAFQRRDGAYGVALLSEAGKMLFAVDLPERGHDIAFDPVHRKAVAFARRPGTFAVVFDHAADKPPLTIMSVEGRHFFGHGVFSPDGQCIVTASNASRSQLDRLLDPQNIAVSLDTITRAARALGKRLIIRIADAKAG